MTAKEYLGQAYRIDQRINSKMEQIASLNLLAQKATTVFSDMLSSAQNITCAISEKFHVALN